jgi:HEPN domain-containing protein
MSFNSLDYLSAAKEHVDGAGKLYNMQCYVLAHYVAGLAVECLLRAYRFRVDSNFDERHDLRALLKASRLADIVSNTDRPRINAALGDVVSRWQNDHRYRSKESLRRFLVTKKLYVKIKDDFVGCG